MGQASSFQNHNFIQGLRGTKDMGNLVTLDSIGHENLIHGSFSRVVSPVRGAAGRNDRGPSVRPASPQAGELPLRFTKAVCLSASLPELFDGEIYIPCCFWWLWHALLYLRARRRNRWAETGGTPVPLCRPVNRSFEAWVNFNTVHFDRAFSPVRGAQAESAAGVSPVLVPFSLAPNAVHVFLSRLQVGFHHDANNFHKTHLWLPTQLLLGFGRIANQ